MQYQQGGGDYTSPYYPNPYTNTSTTTTTSSYPNPTSPPNPPLTPTPNTNPNPMDFNSSTPIQSTNYASAPPYTPYPPEFPPTNSYPYPQPPPPSQFQPQSPQFPSYPSHNPTRYQPDPSPAAPASYYPSFSPPNPNPNPSSYPSLDVPYDTGMNDQYGGRSMSAVEPNMYSKKPYEEPRNEGVYAYSGGSDVPYGARGIGGNSSARSNSGSGMLFDDYGRSISMPSGGSDRGKVVKAVPKMDAQPDIKSGVQKYRVKLLPEGAGSNMDVLCQVGLDGIKMLDPNTSRLLRIYPLETLTRWEVLDSSIFAFWSKSTVDVEPRRIRLKSNSYTTSTILDTVTAATVQFKEMGGGNLSRSRPASDAGKAPEQSAEKKKIFWMNFIKPPNEEKDHWVPDEAVTKCTSCGADFGAFVRRHHCRNCGDIFCDKCTQGRIALTAEDAQPVRVCDRCMAEVSQRLNNAKEAANRPIVHSHEDLARKLQEEMDRNRKSSSASKSESGRRMREVACPVCTVHLQVQVPTSGSETIECGVCQHPFLVSAR